MPIQHLLILWLIVLTAAGVTVALFANGSWGLIILAMAAALALRLWSSKNDR